MQFLIKQILLMVLTTQHFDTNDTTLHNLNKYTVCGYTYNQKQCNPCTCKKVKSARVKQKKNPLSEYNLAYCENIALLK